MKIVFVSNYFNHHQKPFCEEMHYKLGNDFQFIATSTMRDERKQMGYQMDVLPSYVLLSYESLENEKKAMELINNADAVIVGSAPQKLLNTRIWKGKLVIRYSERQFRGKISRLKHGYYYLKYNFKNFPRKNIYMLCASAYTAGDFSKVGLFKGKTYQWGYFPEVKKYDEQKLLKEKNKNQLLWCGRFLELKHPDDVIRVAKRLKDENYQYELLFIGMGEMEKKILDLVEQNDLSDYVKLLGAMKPQQVREYMEQAGIYLFTSDKREGWGAVLNESMNSGCAVVASHAIGSVPFLIKDGENGLIYESGNVDMLYERVKYLLDHPEKQVSLGAAAYRTMTELWNAQVAAERVLHLVERILAGEKTPILYESGPCSAAPVISDQWGGSV